MVDAPIQVKVKRVGPVYTALPAYATNGAAGMDLAANIAAPLVIPPGGSARVPTGIAIQLPSAQVVGLVFARSGLATKHGIALANGVGVIDSDYTGEIICALRNHGSTAYEVKPGDRIAQLVFLPVYRAVFDLTSQFVPTARGDGGFGSTGV